MMLDWLETEENRVEVKELVHDRNEDTIGEILIGYGYGVFRGQDQAEYVGQSSASFTHIGVVVGYAETVDECAVAQGKVYYATHSVPEIGDVCTWRGTTYAITAVDPHPDIHGDLVGYTLRCSSGKG